MCVASEMCLYVGGYELSVITMLQFHETQWRHSVKIRLYNTPSPILHSVKRSAVTLRKQGYIRTPPPKYFNVLNSSVKIMEVEVIEFHRINSDEHVFYSTHTQPTQYTDPIQVQCCTIACDAGPTLS